MSQSTEQLELRAALREVMLWISKLCLQEIDAATLAMLRSKPWREALGEDATPWLDLPEQSALDDAAEAYAAEFVLPQGTGLRLCRFLPGESEALGLGLEREMHAALVTLGKTVDQDGLREKLPADHPSIALSVVAAALEPAQDLSLLHRQRFMLALSRWSERLMQGGQHPLYRSCGRLNHEGLQGLLELMGASDWGITPAAMASSPAG